MVSTTLILGGGLMIIAGVWGSVQHTRRWLDFCMGSMVMGIVLLYIGCVLS